MGCEYPVRYTVKDVHFGILQVTIPKLDFTYRSVIHLRKETKTKQSKTNKQTNKLNGKDIYSKIQQNYEQ